MDSVTQQNAAMVEQATAAARSLSAEAATLAREVARFKLDAAPADTGAMARTIHRLPDAGNGYGDRVVRLTRAAS